MADEHPDAHDHAFILKRATGEIEIRAGHPNALKREMIRHGTTYDFGESVKHEQGPLHKVTGVRKAGI